MRSYEEIIYDETGNILTTTLADYLPPTSHEIPQIEILHLETLTGDTLTQAKGLGEGGAIGAPAAIVNAINDALSPLRRIARRNSGDPAAHPCGA